MLKVILPFPVVEQLQARSRVSAANLAERAAVVPSFDLARVAARDTSAALVKAVFRATKLAAEHVEAAALRIEDPAAREALLQVAASLAEGAHFNGSTLLGSGQAAEEGAGANA